jgi:hypothetical protein
MDHLWPLSRGGAHEPGNVVPACHSCNASKRDRLLWEWPRALKLLGVERFTLLVRRTLWLTGGARESSGNYAAFDVAPNGTPEIQPSLASPAKPACFKALRETVDNAQTSMIHAGLEVTAP